MQTSNNRLQALQRSLKVSPAKKTPQPLKVERSGLNRLQSLEQTLGVQPSQPSVPMRSPIAQEKSQPQQAAKAYDQNETIKLHGSRAEAMAYDHNTPIELHYNPATGGYTSNQPSVAKAQSVIFDSEPEVEAFEVESFEAAASDANSRPPVHPPVAEPPARTAKPVTKTMVPEVLPTDSTPPAQSTKIPTQALATNTPAHAVEPPAADVATDDDFLEDLSAILKGQKVYESNSPSAAPIAQAQQFVEPEAPSPNPQQSSPHDVFDRLEQGLAPDPAPTPEPTYSNAHSVFDQMGKNMAYANSFDLGTISLQQRFDEFDRILEAEETQKIRPVADALAVQPAYALQSSLMTSERLKELAGEPSIRGFFSSTYRKIVDYLKAYESLVRNQPTADEKFAVLLKVKTEINNWLSKGSHQPRFHSFLGTKSEEYIQRRKNALEQIRPQIINEIRSLENLSNLAKIYILYWDLKGSFASEKSPNLLFSYLMDRLINLSKIHEVNSENFKAKLVNLIMPDTGLFGSTNLAIHSDTYTLKLNLSGDPGRSLLFLSSKIEGEIETSLGQKRLILTECQNVLPSTENKRYCAMHMRGSETKCKIGVKFTLGCSTPSPDLVVSYREDSTVKANDVELLSLASVPRFEIPHASAALESNLACTGVALEAVSIKSIYFDERKDAEENISDMILDAETNQANMIDTVKNLAPEQSEKHYLLLFSTAYDAEAFVEGSASTGYNMEPYFESNFNLEAKAGIGGIAKYSNYTYQSQLSSGIFKTQSTNITFKQITVKAGFTVEGNLEHSGKSLRRKKEGKKEYEFLNSLYYNSGVVFWQKLEKSDQALEKEGTGYSVGQSILIDALCQIFDLDEDAQNSYFDIICSTLNYNLSRNDINAGSKLSVEKLKEFFMDEDRKNLIKDIFRQGETQGLDLAYFIEAIFAPAELGKIELNYDDKKHDFFVGDIAISKLYSDECRLESLRFRVAKQNGEMHERMRFKLGLNLGVASIGIDLGRVEEASSLELKDLLVCWYDSEGKLLKEAVEVLDALDKEAEQQQQVNSNPKFVQERNVPSAFLFI